MEILNALAPTLEAGAPYITLLGALFVRISAIVYLAPGLGERSVPQRVRLAAAVGITLVVAPLVLSGAPPPPTSSAELIQLYMAEALSGLVIGFALRLLIFVLEIAGSMAAQHISLSQLFGANVGFDPSSPFAGILVMGALALAAASGIHIHLVNALAESYEVLPFGVFPGAEDAGLWSSARFGEAFAKALALAAPFVILGFIYSLALAAASRAMPQLMAAFVGAPAITLAGLALFAVAAPIIMFEWMDSFERILMNFLEGRL